MSSRPQTKILWMSDMTMPNRHTLHRIVASFILAGVLLLAVACVSEEPVTTEAPDYQATVSAALAKVGADEQPPESTAIAAPAPAPTDVSPSPTPTEVPPSATPETPPGATPTVPVATDAEPLAPLPINDADGFLAEVSDAELKCLTDSLGNDRLEGVLQAPDLADEAERAALLGCLEHETSLRLLLTPVLSETGPLSPETSACLRGSYADEDLNALMSSQFAASDPGPESEAAGVAAMVTFIVSLSCLNEEEFQIAAPAMGFAPGEYENFQCVLEQVGGQDAMVALLTPAAEFPAALFEAAIACQLQMAGPPPG